MRYPSDVTDDEWALAEPLIPLAKRGGDRRHVVVREVVNGLMCILSAGCQWRAIPKDLPPRSTLYDYFDLWSWDGTLDRTKSSCRASRLRQSATMIGPSCISMARNRASSCSRRTRIRFRLPMAMTLKIGAAAKSSCFRPWSIFKGRPWPSFAVEFWHASRSQRGGRTQRRNPVLEWQARPAMFDLKELARLLDGDASVSQVVAPGPRHSRKDRSLSVRLHPLRRMGSSCSATRAMIGAKVATTCASGWVCPGGLPRAGRRKPADGCLIIRKITAGRSRFGGGGNRLSGPLLSAACWRREAIMVRSLRCSVFSRLKGSIRLP